MACSTDVPIPNNWLMESMLRSWSTGQIEVWSEKDGNWRAQTGTVPTADIDSASVSVLVRVPRQAKCLLGFGEELFNRTVLNTGKSTPSFHSYNVCASDVPSERQLRIMVWTQVSAPIGYPTYVVKGYTEVG